MTQAYPLTSCQSLKPGQMKRFIVNDKAVLLANVNGEVFAIADLCSHEDAILSNGALKDGCVECPLHGSRFDLKTGQPREEPATEPVDTYAVEIREDTIYIQM
jgi:3-phenylpropionate/trans-cinnamate dioxygenase ferredoxin subunit